MKLPAQILIDSDFRAVIVEWFFSRFEMTPSELSSYFDEWVERFADGSWYAKMDNESRRVFALTILSRVKERKAHDDNDHAHHPDQKCRICFPLYHSDSARLRRRERLHKLIKES